MDQRHSINQNHMYEMDREQIWNHPQHDHHLNFGNSSMFPAENTTTNGANPVTYFNSHLRSNNHQMEYFNSQVPVHVQTNDMVIPYDVYTHFPCGGSISQHPPHSMQHGFSHNQYAVGDIRRNVNPLIEMEYERSPYKRKFLANFVFPHGENTNRYNSAGSSSNPTISTEISQGKPHDSQCWPCDPVSFDHSHRSENSSNSGQGSQRNVRSRHDTAIHLENISSGVRTTTNSSHLVQSIASTLNANMGAQWIHSPVFINPNSRSFSSETNSFSYDINHSFVANHGTANNMGIDGGYRSNLQSHSGPLLRGRMMAPIIHGQRTAYRVNPSYQAVDLAATSQNTRLQRVESARSSVPPMPSSIVHRNNRRNGRMSRSNRFRSFLNEDASHVRRTPERIVLMDHSALYDPMHFLDQHRHMRLDTDNMSYEELLALEESIGNVSAGLSEDAIRMCLRETIFCSDQTENGHEEDCCPICLEVYKDRDTLGQLNCKHIFHSSCLKKWLLIKNICPICKASALEDTSK
ncbi:probable E3 ubiquitin-protein ligase ZFP1 isoform X3 [Zingiber officinale]|nr:probable E3 ubiquitin-protein ligase ZFP1 isoform X3 [Zingiber officinale]XP_042389516.1 probable E3 ubiquitin-protein ligase ZFP1 isoform X3 [Zingiber officinale]XP_042389517.1 probable E3 ubiquitin-protein ligase ZFP1 isoform X3 [Zingiber officinale]XP_042389518.1 probable E3 ubiquitin-protein ligase ZFP1 isoform X3 [Zingiber officinale]XP_042389519.1 probable E3 ubiquitin-protein ligase ZFP1 isoform X3 [Zingiber officinale]XP_042389521.1 probable E3 ubiquitin-protein ligase ZFP1 isoform 